MLSFGLANFSDFLPLGSHGLGFGTLPPSRYRLIPNPLANPKGYLVQEIEPKDSWPFGFSRNLTPEEKANQIRAELARFYNNNPSAEDTIKVKRALASKAGSAPKGDNLNKLMQPILRQKPDIGFDAFIMELERDREAGGIITDITDSGIEFDNGRNGASKIVFVPMAALQRRFYRMKKSLTPTR